MTERPLDREALFEALSALRGAPDPSAPVLAWAWHSVNGFVDHRLRRPSRAHDDVRQRTLIKVLRGVAGMQADTPAGAEGWLRTVYRSARTEHHRGLDPVREALRHERGDEGLGPRVDRLAALPPERTEDDVARLEAAREAVLGRVDAWLEANVTKPSKRVGDRRRAAIAWTANVLGRDVEAIRESFGIEEKRDTVYKWIERGREQVLLPAMAAWERELEAAGEDAAVPQALSEILRGARRADAGKARPGRRSVSRAQDGTSVQSKRRNRGS